MIPRAAAASSEHPVPAHAVAECAGELIERHMGGSDQLLVFAGMPFAGALGDMSAALKELLSAGAVAAIVSEGVLMGARVATGGPALAVVALRHPGVGASWVPPEVSPCVAAARSGPDLALVLADPFTVRSVELDVGSEECAHFVAAHLVSGRGAGTNHMVIDGVEHREGSVLIGFSSEAGVAAVAGDATPFSRPLEITACDGRRILTIDGLPAADAFEQMVVAAAQDVLAGAEQLGLRLLGGSEFVAVDRERDALRCAFLRFGVGDRVEAVVRSAGAARSELGRVVEPHGAAVQLCLSDVERPGAQLAGVEGSILADSPGCDRVGLLVSSLHASFAGGRGAGIDGSRRGAAAVVMLRA